jgi:hypothetical protein
MTHPGQTVLLVSLQLVQRVPRASRARIVGVLKIANSQLNELEMQVKFYVFINAGRTPQQVSQFNQSPSLLILFLPDFLKLNRQHLDVATKVLQRFQTVLEIPEKHTPVKIMKAFA